MKRLRNANESGLVVLVVVVVLAVFGVIYLVHHG